jgi:hypothetical protein
MDDEDVTSLGIAELAEALGVTPRRVRQLREDGDLVKRGPAKIDAPHAMNASLGWRFLAQRGGPRPTKFEAAGVGWLLGHRGLEVGRLELDAWHTAAARWGLAEDEALGVLMNAAALLGDKAPTFKTTKRRRAS